MDGSSGLSTRGAWSQSVHKFAGELVVWIVIEWEDKKQSEEKVRDKTVG